jgi:5-carboxymethyl-2-hydroxymuconic-semialdehyde dehydrogenase
MLSTWRIAPALATGNTVILKPAEWSPLTAWKLAQIFEEADMPPGVFNVVQGFGEEAGAPLVGHPLVPLITFTGETTTGSIVMKTGADQLKRLSLELGGKSPAVIFADADLDRALDATVFQIYSFNGERCTANSRALIEECVFDEFTAALAARAARVKVGSPLDPDTEVGPLIHPEHRDRVLGYIDTGKQEGAKLLVGGERVGSEGNYVSPALFTGQNHMRIAQEEIFGPVISAIPFDNIDEVIERANRTNFGLGSGLWTRDVTKVHKLARGIRAGSVWINCYQAMDPAVPFGGYKMSGYGRESGKQHVEEYLNVKSVWIKTS